MLLEMNGSYHAKTEVFPARNPVGRGHGQAGWFTVKMISE